LRALTFERPDHGLYGITDSILEQVYA
jgi:hypothetical protein